MANQQELASGMIHQLRLLDPSVSAEIGTPERKIIDTVAQALAENQIDINQLSAAFDLDSKFGSDLDLFVSIFGFGRQKGAQATGYVKLSRTTPSTFNVPIPAGTQITAPAVSLRTTTISLVYSTTQFTEISPGSLSATAPIRCSQVGQIGNVAIGTITTFANAPILGITDVLNEVPTSGGVDPETDAELKVRFKNTVFRNLAGTQDQFLALAVATQFTTKANVVGPISRYREYIQVPDVDDATADPDSSVSGNGRAGEWTSALSTIPYSKHVYDTIPYFVADGRTPTTFYRRDTDFYLNLTDTQRNRGDTFRGSVLSTGPPLSDPTTDFQPNVTFRNVLPFGSTEEAQSLRAKDVVLFEHSYMSSASRNDYGRRVLNCVDVFLNGRNPQLADAVVPKPNNVDNLFSASRTNRFYLENFRRVGETNHRPVSGNIFLGLFWTPIVDIPDTIVTSDGTFVKGVHYWAVEDVSDIGRSVRARTGIEINPTIKAKVAADSADGPYTGPRIAASADTTLSVLGYTYDRNIVDLQTSLEANKQVTSDVLGHQAKIRYLKLDITVMYATGSSVSDVNSQIQLAVRDFLDGQYFGTTIQMSDLLQVIHNVGGVDNVRWSRDITTNRNRVVECDVNGEPLTNVVIDRRVAGDAGESIIEIQQMYITGEPESGDFQLEYGTSSWTEPIQFDDLYSTINTFLTSPLAGSFVGAQIVEGSGTVTDPWIINYGSAGARSLITLLTNNLSGGSNIFNTDFFLKDDELPALPTGQLSTDTVPGLVIRPRAANTWNQL